MCHEIKWSTLLSLRVQICLLSSVAFLCFMCQKDAVGFLYLVLKLFSVSPMYVSDGGLGHYWCLLSGQVFFCRQLQFCCLLRLCCLRCRRCAGVNLKRVCCDSRWSVWCCSCSVSVKDCGLQGSAWLLGWGICVWCWCSRFCWMRLGLYTGVCGYVVCFLAC